MIRQEIYILKYDWTVYAYYAVDCYYTDEIAHRLYDIGCKGGFLERAIQNMASCQLNQGLCYSNPETHESVLVIALTTTAAQFADSQAHEVGHLTIHICDACGIDLRGEESRYLEGWIARQMYPCVKGLLCENCRKE